MPVKMEFDLLRMFCCGFILVGFCVSEEIKPTPKNDYIKKMFNPERELSSHIAAFYNGVQNGSIKLQRERLNCSHDMNFTTITNDEDRRFCCNEIDISFRQAWTGVLVHLSDFLRALRDLQCSQFNNECDARTYAFTEFNSLTYDRFCNESQFMDKCENTLTEILLKHGGSVNINHTDPGNITDLANGDTTVTLLKQIKQTTLTLDEMLKTCVQAALVNVNSCAGYFEVKETQAPMCGIVWCGFTSDAFKRYDISEWICMPARCRANIIILMVVAGLLSVASTLTNTIALIVFWKNKKLRDSQGIYKISLAVADLLIGVFVFPTVIETMKRAYMPSMLLHHRETDDGMSPKMDIGSFNSRYFNFIGFFSTWSNSVSVYILVMASFDRFMVVFRPLRYNLYTAKSLAIKISIAVWVLALMFSLIPIVLPNFEYRFIAALFVFISGDGEMIILAIAFVIPIFCMLVTHVATYVFSKKNAKARPKVISSGAKVRSISVENRLAKTLSIMVVAYLVCLLPMSVVIGLHFVLTEIDTFYPAELNINTLTLVTSLEIIFCILFISNSLLNFFIYNIRSKEFRSACTKLFNITKSKLKSKLMRSSAKAARDRRTSAAISNASHITVSSNNNGTLSINPKLNEAK
ncbi:uncharacterized protein LOC120331318 [Styela clava]